MSEREIYKKNEREKIYDFIVIAYRRETNGRYDPENGVETEHQKTLRPITGKPNYQLAYDTAISYGKRVGYFPVHNGYYGHWAKSSE